MLLGDHAAARRPFESVVNGGYLRVFTPFEYVRSQRFLLYWKHGDVDRDTVAEAIKKTS